MTKPVLKTIPLADLRESVHNHRRHFNQQKIEEMAQSIREIGILTPLTVRPHPDADGEYEIGAGTRRSRGALIAGLTEVPCYVREMDDVAFRVLINVENLQRDDVHAIDEADGYRDLMELTGDDAPRLAKRLGKELHEIYAKLQLLKLVPAAREMFLAGRFSESHAMEISRQTREVQEQIIAVGNGLYDSNGPLWRNIEGVAGGLFDAEEREKRAADPFFMMEPVTVTELKSWINKHVRFRAGEIEAPELFADTVAKLEDAKDMKLKVVAITYSHRVEQSIKGEGRIYGPDDWRRADGSEESSTCAEKVGGLVVAGPHRGEMFDVCVSKKKCLVHFADVIKALEKRQRQNDKVDAPASKSAPAMSKKAAAKLEKERQQQAAHQAKRERDQKIHAVARPAIFAASLAVVAKGSASACGVKGPIGKFVLKALTFGEELYFAPQGLKRAPKAGDAAGIVRFMAELLVRRDESSGTEFVIDNAAALGIDTKKMLKDALAVVQKAEKTKAAA